MQSIQHHSSFRLSPLGQCPVVLYLLGSGALVLLSPAFGAEALPDGVTVETASSLTHQVRLLDADAPACHLRVHPSLKQTDLHQQPHKSQIELTNHGKLHYKYLAANTDI